MRRIIVVIVALAALLGPAAVCCPSALADGDPASDVLLYRPVFDPPDAGLSAAEYAQLAATVQASTRAGYPIKVALIASSSDLGTVTQLWEDPRGYVQYLGLELSDVWRGRTLVVMPQGESLWVNGRASTGDQRVMPEVQAPGSQLAQGAIETVRALAQANGVTVSVGSVSVPTAAGGSSSAAPVIVFLAGLLAVAGAWGLSLRARPLRRRVAA